MSIPAFASPSADLRHPGLDRLVIVSPSAVVAAGVAASLAGLPTERLKVRRSCTAMDVAQDFSSPTRSADLRRVAVVDAAHLAARPGRPACACIERLVAGGYAVVVLGAHPGSRLAARALALGAHLVLGVETTPEELSVAVGEVEQRRATRKRGRSGAAYGIPDLTPQELAALTGYAEGRTLHSVARSMGVKPDTARTYLARVRRKYRLVGRPVGSRVDYFIRAVQDGYLAFPED